MPTDADLATSLSTVARAVVAAQQPVLERHGLTRWGYAVLRNLETTPVRSQAALAAAIGADKTRMITVLDDLQERGLISRVPDPSDRRVRLLGLTAKGRRLRDTAQRAVQRADENALQELPPGERQRFVRTLHRLADACSAVGRA